MAERSGGENERKEEWRKAGRKRRNLKRFRQSQYVGRIDTNGCN